MKTMKIIEDYQLDNDKQDRNDSKLIAIIMKRLFPEYWWSGHPAAHVIETNTSSSLKGNYVISIHRTRSAKPILYIPVWEAAFRIIPQALFDGPNGMPVEDQVGGRNRSNFGTPSQLIQEMAMRSLVRVGESYTPAQILANEFRTMHPSLLSEKDTKMIEKYLGLEETAV